MAEQQQIADLEPVSTDVHHRIARFLFEEAELLDQRRYRDWLALFSEDAEYFVPLRIHRQQTGTLDDWALEKELSGTDELPVTRHNFESLSQRVAQLVSGRTVSETPPWLTERLITNIVADRRRDRDEYQVRSKFLIQRIKKDRENLILGHRIDHLRPAGSRFRIARRYVVLNATSYRWPNFVLI